MSLLQSRTESVSRKSYGDSHPLDGLALELFSSRWEAEARIELWARQGQRVVWLHEVHSVAVADFRSGCSPKIMGAPDEGGVIYAVVKVG